MYTFKKKPVIIEAFQMTLARRWNNSEWPGWLHEAWNGDPDTPGSLWIDPDEPPNPEHDSADGLMIGTLEGALKLTFGCWIIQGVAGELYAWRDDIFRATYDQV